jgi:hypothetical protein
LKPAGKESFAAPIFAANRFEAAPAQGNGRKVGINRGFEPFHPHRESSEAISRYCPSAKRIEYVGTPTGAGHSPPPISNCSRRRRTSKTTSSAAASMERTCA